MSLIKLKSFMGTLDRILTHFRLSSVNSKELSSLLWTSWSKNVQEAFERGVLINGLNGTRDAVLHSHKKKIISTVIVFAFGVFASLTLLVQTEIGVFSSSFTLYLTELHQALQSKSSRTFSENQCER